MTISSGQPSDVSTNQKWYRARAQSISGNAPARNVPHMDNAAWTISSRLAAGLILYTGLGYLVSLWLGNRTLFMAVGALIGLGLSYYLIFSSLARENRELSDSKKGHIDG